MQRSPTTTGFWWGHLPHWEVEEGRYFITLRLAGSIPAFALDQIHAKIESLRKQPFDGKSTASMKTMRSVFRDYEMWLDKSRGAPLLAQPLVANMVREAIDHRIKIGAWVVYEYVVMPNHIHLFLSVLRGTLKSTLIDFKRWTGHQAAKLTALNQGRFWQNEWFDHWSRSDEQDERISAYIRHNPVKAGLVTQYQDWPYGSWCR